MAWSNKVAYSSDNNSWEYSIEIDGKKVEQNWGYKTLYEAQQAADQDMKDLKTENSDIE